MSTILLSFTFPKVIIVAVEMMFKTIFCAVPAFILELPVTNSGPTTISIGNTAVWLKGAFVYPETGKLKSRPVHVAQIARLRIPLHERAVEELSPHTVGGSERDVVLAEDELWERLRVPGHVVFRFKDDEVF